MWQGVLQSLAPLVGGGLALFLYHRRTAEVEEGHQWTDAIGLGGIRMAFAFAILTNAAQRVHINTRAKPATGSCQHSTNDLRVTL